MCVLRLISEPCGDMKCQNGATCHLPNRECICDHRYSGKHCEGKSCLHNNNNTNNTNNNNNNNTNNTNMNNNNNNNNNTNNNNNSNNYSSNNNPNNTSLYFRNYAFVPSLIFNNI